MTEPSRAPTGQDRQDTAFPRSAEGLTAGAMLKAARERQGLHIAILAATIKVSPRKLEALENDRHEELANASFVRALAQSVCRSLKIDPLPVLALLPVPEPTPLERSVGSLNAPFRDRPGRTDNAISGNTSRPVLWTGALLLLAAAAVYFAPPQFWATAVRLPERAAAKVPAVEPAPPVAVPSEGATKANVPAPGEAVASAPAVLPEAVAAGLAAASAGQAASPTAVPAGAGLPAVVTSDTATATPPASSSRVQLSANAVSWVEAIDADGKTLLSRTLMPGEAVDVDGAFPIRLKVGNAAGTQVALRGRPVDLTSYTRDNVARLELR